MNAERGLVHGSREELPAGGTNPHHAGPPFQGQLQQIQAKLTVSDVVADNPIDEQEQTSTPLAANLYSSDDLATFPREEFSNAACEPMLTSRRRQSSFPNGKPPQGPRPLDAQLGKR